jgi:hypothetical protein
MTSDPAHRDHYIVESNGQPVVNGCLKQQWDDPQVLRIYMVI